MQAILCTGYYTSRCIQLESMQPDALHCMLHVSIYALKYAPDCTQLHTTSLFYYTVPIALDGTLRACVTDVPK